MHALGRKVCKVVRHVVRYSVSYCQYLFQLGTLLFVSIRNVILSTENETSEKVIDKIRIGCVAFGVST